MKSQTFCAQDKEGLTGGRGPMLESKVGEMVIPIRAVDSRSPEPGRETRINFYRAQVPPGPEHVSIAWQPTHSATYHVPEVFGTLRLVK